MKSIIINEVCINIFKHCYYFIADFQFSLVSWICSNLINQTKNTSACYISAKEEGAGLSLYLK